jgi:flagellar basal-body rod modification protein FlgD
MEISAPNATTQTAPAPAAAPGAGTKIGADFNTFLTMLTTQMKNQDPLNPVESSDFAVQLATFSGVEQQVQTNDLLRAMGAAGAMGGLSQFAGWVGMEARSVAPIDVASGPVELHYDMPLGAVASELVLRNGSGMEVRRMAVTGPGPMIWDGTGPGGGALPAGAYTATLESRDAAGKVTTDTVGSYARVAELRAEPDGAVAILDSGARVPVSEITALRAAH